MPRQPIDYSKTIIYKIVCNDLDIKDLYVGSTTDFNRRKREHKLVANKENHRYNHLKIYQSINLNGGFENWSMIEIEKYPCSDGNEARARERYHYELLNANLNSNKPFRLQEDNECYKLTAKTYRKTNHDQLLQKRRIYKELNKEKLQEQSKKYEENNKERMKMSSKISYEKNKEKIKARRKLRYENNKEINKEKTNASSRLYYQNNKEKIKLNYENNKEEIKSRNHLYYEKNKEEILKKQRLKEGINQRRTPLEQIK